MRAIDALRAQRWAILPEWLPLLAALAERDRETARQIAADLGRPDWAPGALDMRVDQEQRLGVRARRRGAVAIVPVTGPMFPRANMMTEMSGATSMQIVGQDLRQAAENPEIKAILLDMDTPGGVAFGPEELAAEVARAAESKPVWAHVGGMACSAGYWVASAAQRIVMAESAIVGSIGVVATSYVQEHADQDGYRVVEVVSSNADRKRPNAGTEDGVAQIRAEIDGIEAVFLDAVARGRGVSVETVTARFGRGQCFAGAEAVSRGMADAIGSFEDTLAALVAETESAGPAARRAETERAAPAGRPSEEKTMDWSTITVEELTANRPDLVSALTETARTDGQAAGAAAERERITGIDKVAHGTGQGELAAKLKADGKTTPAEAAMQILEASKARLAAADRARRQDMADVPAAPASASGDGGIDPALSGSAPKVDPSAPLEDRAKAAWDSDPALRSEFGTLNAYQAYLRAEEGGRVRIFKGNKEDKAA